MTEPAASDGVEKQALIYGVSIRDAVVFLVDWRRSMLINTCPIRDGSDIRAPMLSVVLRSISDIMKSKIISRNTDIFGVVAFGAVPAAGDRWPGIRVIRPLDRLNADGINKLDAIATLVERLAADDDSLDDNLRKMETDGKEVCFGDDLPVQFDKALWAAKNQLGAAKAEKTNVLHRRKVFVLTNDEDPSGGSAGVRKLAEPQTKDLFELGATIDVTLLSSNSMLATMESEEQGGSSSSFFDDVISGGDDDGKYVARSLVARNVTSLEDLVSKIQHRQRTKRALVRTTLHLSGDCKFGVSLYSLVQRARRPSKVELFADTNQPVKKITTATCESIGKSLRPADIRYMHKLSSLRQVRVKKVTNDPATQAAAKATKIANDGSPKLFGLTANELVEIGNLGERGMVLYGFRKRSTFREEHNLRPPMFMYPDELTYTGSRAMFTQLLQSMIQKDVIAIVLMRVRGRSPPRFAALLPQDEEYDEDGMQAAPPGFHVFPLPFKNDLRTAWRAEMAANDPASLEKSEDMLEDEAEAVAAATSNLPPAGTEEAQRMIKKLTIKHYHPTSFANPDLQLFYSKLQTAAGVDSGANEEEELMIHPKEDQMRLRAGDALENFKAVTMGPAFDGAGAAEMFGVKSKRKEVESVARLEQKRAKLEEEHENAKKIVDMNDFKARFKAGTLDKLRKTDLVLYLKANRIHFPASAKKAECVTRVRNSLKSKFGDL